MWGTRRQSGIAYSCQRFIPTHVGNSKSSPSFPSAIAVHPHACGELFSLSSLNPKFFGSSPRMWGTRSFMGSKWILCRFIPTHVGNSALQRDKSCTSPVHPHACGELSSNSLNSDSVIGSSPRMWGTLIHYQLRYIISRFIPTHVGNS